MASASTKGCSNLKGGGRAGAEAGYEELRSKAGPLGILEPLRLFLMKRKLKGSCPGPQILTKAAVTQQGLSMVSG